MQVMVRDSVIETLIQNRVETLLTVHLKHIFFFLLHVI